MYKYAMIGYDLKVASLYSTNKIVQNGYNGYPYVVDITGRDDVLYGWDYDPETGLFSAPKATPELKAEKEKELRKSLDEINFSAFNTENGQTVSMNASTVAYLGLCTAIAMQTNALPEDFSAPIDSITKTPVSITTPDELFALNNEVISFFNRNIEMFHQVYSYLYSDAITLESQLEDIYIGMEINS